MKRLVYLGILIIGISLLLFYSNVNAYNKDLQKIFPKEIGVIAKYMGVAEYGHNITLKDIKKEKNQIVFLYEGYMNDAISEDYEKRRFGIKYIITDNHVQEIINNKDEYKQVDGEDRLNSIIPNQIILKTPLEVDNSWQQIFEYKGEMYEANTKLVDIKVLSDGRKQYTTKTIVENIPGFFQKTYVEERIYEEGKGLVGFANTIEEYYIGVNRALTQEDFMFGYYQTMIIHP
jgi:hypothetical protein